MRLWLLLILLVSQVSMSSDLRVVKTLPPASIEDTSHQLFTDILKQALALAANQYGSSQLVFSDIKTHQGRTLRLIEEGMLIDVYWAGTSKEREQKLRKIPIDPLGGILGVRNMIIRSQDWPSFAKVVHKSSLQKRIACQGRHWPDTQILENAGFRVLKTGEFSTNFELLNMARCDYFPRGIHEGLGEINHYIRLHGANLALFEEVLLVYPFNMYFFVKKDNVALAELLEFGMNKALSEGLLQSLVENHPVTQHLFPLSRWQNKQYFRLDNPNQTLVDGYEANWLIQQMPFFDAFRAIMKQSPEK